MRFHVILNRDGGSLRSRDVERFADETSKLLEELGHEVKPVVVDGAGVEDALRKAAQGDADIVMVGGGDGTISAAAACFAGSDKALAVLPAGTMNLFARSLDIPLDLDAAVRALVNGRVRAVDVAQAGDRIFVHQFSVGLHTKLVRLREKHNFSSRLGKMWASFRAGVAAFLRPPRLAASLTVDGRPIIVRTAGIAITNNLFGEGYRLPYAAHPAGGVLGAYVTRAGRRRDLMKFAIAAMLGRWRRNEHVDIHSGQEMTLRLMAHHRRFGCSIDGELAPLAEETRLRILSGALRVLVPSG